ncbi:MAG: putative ABC transporter permease [Acetatifactor sp.]
MWDIQLFGMDLYHFMAAFVLYSMIGWLVESIYMSICEKKITNRGFARGPFCPIYGVGALGAVILFTPIKDKYWLVYILGCIVATVFEFIVGKLMIRFLGSLWWDYNEKFLNYQGIICLESTLAWGLYALIIVHILHGKLMMVADLVERRVGIIFICVILLIVGIDYITQLKKVFRNKK